MRSHFGRLGIGSLSHAPTLRQKIDNLMIPIQITDNAQEFRDGCTNVGILTARKFLSRLAREFRVSLLF